MRDYIKTQIAERRSREAGLEKELLTVRAERHAYEDMLRHLDANQEESSANILSEQAKQVGPIRKPTATSFQMSGHWAKILRRLVDSGKSFGAADIVHAADQIGAPMKTPNARSQIAYYKKKKVIRRVQPGKYVLTDAGKEMLEKAEGSSAATPEPSKSTEGGAGSPAGTPNLSSTGSTPVPSTSPAGKLLSSSAVLSGPYPPQFPLREKGG